MNTCTLVGRVGKYIEVSNGYLNFSLATDEHWRDKTTGEKRNRVDWHSISSRNVNLGSWITPGTQLAVTGGIRVDIRENPQTGESKTFVNIAAHRIEILDRKQVQHTERNGNVRVISVNEGQAP